MTVNELKRGYYRHKPEGHFFDRETMAFFGDTLRNFGVCDGGVKTLPDGDSFSEVPVWDLYRKRPVTCGRYGFVASFRKDNFAEV
jgi:hypothetical protein